MYRINFHGTLLGVGNVLLKSVSVPLGYRPQHGVSKIPSAAYGFLAVGAVKLWQRWFVH